MTDLLADIERNKYVRVWADDRYRQVSPGMLEAVRATAKMDCLPGDSLNDYGCGTGRATAWWRDQEGLEVLGIDHAANALETDVPFLQACLWEDGIPHADYGFCCDVMEHIPPAKVKDVLATIASTAAKQTWMRIALGPDGCGPAIIGEPLHLMLSPGWWWVQTLRAYWDVVETIEETPGLLVCLCSHAASWRNKFTKPAELKAAAQMEMIE